MRINRRFHINNLIITSKLELICLNYHFQRFCWPTGCIRFKNANRVFSLFYTSVVYSFLKIWANGKLLAFPGTNIWRTNGNCSTRRKNWYLWYQQIPSMEPLWHFLLFRTSHFDLYLFLNRQNVSFFGLLSLKKYTGKNARI